MDFGEVMAHHTSDEAAAHPTGKGRISRLPQPAPAPGHVAAEPQ
ncbi:hypothetical protein [Streptomyces sp. NPDC051577]